MKTKKYHLQKHITNNSMMIRHLAKSK